MPRQGLVCGIGLSARDTCLANRESLARPEFG